MSERILEIKEVEIPGRWDGASGYEVVTDQQRITLTIDDGQSCCERWGYFMSEDDTQQFVGAHLLGVELTDTALNPVKLKEHDVDTDDSWFEGGVMFVDIKTDRGVLQFVAYNVHNGYYGHTAKVVSTQLTHEETL